MNPQRKAKIKRFVFWWVEKVYLELSLGTQFVLYLVILVINPNAFWDSSLKGWQIAILVITYLLTFLIFLHYILYCVAYKKKQTRVQEAI